MKIEKAVEITVAPPPEPPRPDIQRPPERDENEYLEWRQELL